MSAVRSTRPCIEPPEEGTELDEALRRAFWTSLNRHPLPALQALAAAARTIGTLYRQIAQAHEGPGGCACGWEPDPDSDLIVLEANLAASLLKPPEPDLAHMPTLGRA